MNDEILDKKPAEVVIDDSASNDISGDDSVAYESWMKYEEAVIDGKERKPKDEPIMDQTALKGLQSKFEFNVDHALDNIDLSFPNYTPSKDAIEFFNIMRLVYGEDFETPNAIVHYFFVDLVFNNVTREMFPYPKEITDKIRLNPKKIAIIAARFTSKSTVLTAFMPIYCAITGKMPGFGPVMFWVAFGDSQQAGAKVQANTIRDICMDSAFCKEHFEKMRFTDEECEFIRRGSEPVKKRAFMFKTKGAAGGSVRGIRYKTERPQILSFDDAIKNEADANSPIIMAKLKSMIYSDAENALGKKGKIIIVNTPFNKKDPVYSALENGVWTPLAIPLCEKIEIGMSKEDYRGSWEAMKSFEEVYERYVDAVQGQTLREFNQEMMLRISNADDRMIKDDMLNKYSRKVIMRSLDKFTILITTDFTASNSKKGDYSGIAVWAIGSDNDTFLLDLELRKRTIQEQYEALFRMVSKWGRNGRVLEVGIEIDGQQKLNVFALKKMMIEKNIWFRFARQKDAPNGREGIMSRSAGGNKLERFRYMMPRFEMGKMWFPEELDDTPDMKEMMEELKYLTYDSIGSTHDDGLDLISQLGMIDYILPTQEFDVDDGLTEADSNIWASFEDEDDDYTSNSSVVF